MFYHDGTTGTTVENKEIAAENTESTEETR
jgi:hypothetical protein